MDSGLDGAEAKIHCFGNFFIAQFFVPEEQKRHSVLWMEGIDNFADNPLPLPLFHEPVGAIFTRSRYIFGLNVLFAQNVHDVLVEDRNPAGSADSLEVVQGMIYGNPVNPCIDLGFFFEGAEIFVHLDEDFLREVAGIGFVAGKTKGKIQDLLPVLAVDIFEILKIGRISQRKFAGRFQVEGNASMAALF